MASNKALDTDTKKRSGGRDNEAVYLRLPSPVVQRLRLRSAITRRHMKEIASEALIRYLAELDETDPLNLDLAV